MKVWDLHCDTLYELRRAEKGGHTQKALHNDLHIDLEKLQQGDYLLQCFGLCGSGRPPPTDPLVASGRDRHLQAAHGGYAPGVHRRRP